MRISNCRIRSLGITRTVQQRDIGCGDGLIADQRLLIQPCLLSKVL